MGVSVNISWWRISHSSVCECAQLMISKICIHFFETCLTDFCRFISMVHLKQISKQPSIKFSLNVKEYGNGKGYFTRIPKHVNIFANKSFDLSSIMSNVWMPYAQHRRHCTMLSVALSLPSISFNLPQDRSADKMSKIYLVDVFNIFDIKLFRTECKMNENRFEIQILGYADFMF